MSGLLEMFTDFVCPWCYLGEKQLQQAIDGRDIVVRYVYFPLHPETPIDGMTLQQLFAGRNVDVEKSQAELGKMMRDEGLSYGLRTHTYNSNAAQHLAKYLEMIDTGVDAEIARRFRAEVFLAYFARGENIARPDVLADILLKSGVEGVEVQQALTDTAAAGELTADWEYCRNNYVTSVPAYRIGGNWVRGCGGVEVLESLIRAEHVD